VAVVGRRARGVWWWSLVVVVALGLAAGVIALEAMRTAPVRGALRAFTALITATNRDDLDAVRARCSARYLRTHSIKLADEGGVLAMPRAIHKNFRAWTQDGAVWICPGNRVGLVFQMVPERGEWKFDGLVGMLRPGKQFIPIEELQGGGIRSIEE
jgi:hypothetical protein